VSELVDVLIGRHATKRTAAVDSATVLVISASKRCDELMQRCASCWISNTVNR
jgi:hypothetical protein